MCYTFTTMKISFRRIITSLIFICVFFYALSINSGSFLGSGKDEEKDGTPKAQLFKLKDIQKVIPETTSFVCTTPDRAIVSDIDGDKIGQVLHTMPDCKDLRGFVGPIPMLIAIDSKGLVASFAILENQETPAFLNRVVSSDIFEKWTGKNASDAVEVEVDAVSGATYSSTCIIKSVKSKLAKHAAITLKEDEENLRQSLIELTAWLFLIFSLFCYHPKSPMIKYRKTFLLIAILIPGLLLGRFISLGLIRGWAIDGIPYSTQLYMTVLMALAIFLPLFLGRSYYCTWYCPFGAAQELLVHTPNKKFTPGPKISKALHLIRPVLVFTIVGLIIAGIKIDVYQFEPFSVFLFKSASTITIILAIVILLLSIFIRKPWCTYCCPTGAFLEANRHASFFGPRSQKATENKNNGGLADQAGR